MKTTRILLGLVMLCGVAFSAPAQTITTTPTDGPTTITIHARTTNGKLPVDVSCTVFTPMLRQQWDGPIPPPLPVVGKSGDWTAKNVPPGFYAVGLRSSNYVEDTQSSQLLRVEAGNNYSIDFVLSRGAKFKGRVLDAATGKPIAQAVVYGMTERIYDIRTDAEGRYELPHITGTLKVEALTTDHVAQIVKLDAAGEDSMVTVSDIRLQHGGWILGRVERPAEVESNASATISLEIQGSLPTNSVIYDAYTGKDDTFRAGPLPSGTYTLRAEWRRTPFIIKGGPPQNWQAMGSVSDIKVVVGQDTTNVLIPTKLTNPANDRSGR
jgi:hypothetical protein